jgi:hypothetical protein
VSLDTDGNGLITATEWSAVFVSWNDNGDAFLDEDEFLLDNGFDQLDVDDDGFLSAAEFSAAMSTWDLNADGWLSATELDPFI